jgi:hypothetical protein
MPDVLVLYYSAYGHMEQMHTLLPKERDRRVRMRP